MNKPWVAMDNLKPDWYDGTDNTPGEPFDIGWDDHES